MSLQFLEDSLKNKNVIAFMDMIAKSEGANYNSLFGDTLNGTHIFTDFSKHPDIKVPYGNTTSTAAGRYQLLFHSWEAIRLKYNLPDFSTHSQDIACAELISERNVLQHVINGDFDIALRACSNIWASLFYASYGQPIHPLQQYAAWYKDAGGSVA